MRLYGREKQGPDHLVLIVREGAWIFFPESIKKLNKWPLINIHVTTELMGKYFPTGESNLKTLKKKKIVTLFCPHPLITFV